MVRYIEITKADLTTGGNIIRQGDHFTQGYLPRDAKGALIDLTGKTIAVSLYTKQGVRYEGEATFDAATGEVSYTVASNIGYGTMWAEFTATDVADPDYRQKFPSNEQDTKMQLIRGIDDLDFAGVPGTTVAQLRSEQESAQQSYEVMVDGKIETYVVESAELKAEFNAAMAALTTDSEVVNARQGAATLGENLSGITAQLAEKAEQQALEVEKQRINNFIALPEGATTNDARLEDITVGYDGIVHASPGEAVRKIGTDFAQYKSTELNETNFINELPNGVKNEITKNEYGKYVISKKVGNEYKLKDVDIVQIIRGTNIDRVQINKDIFINALKVGWGSVSPIDNLMIEGFIPKPYANSIDNQYSFYGSSVGDVYLSTPPNKYATITDARNDLRGKNVLFELSTPTEYTLETSLSYNTKTTVNILESLNKINNAGITSEMVINMMPNGVVDEFEERSNGFVFVKKTNSKIITEADFVGTKIVTYTNLDYIRIKKPADSFAFGQNTLSLNTIFIEGVKPASATTDSIENIGKTVTTGDTAFVWFGVNKATSLEDGKNLVRGLKLKYQLKVTSEIPVQEEINANTAELIRQSIKPKLMPLVTFTLDDGNSTDYAFYKMLQKKGMRGTSFVIGVHVETGAVGNFYLSETQIKEMADLGWEIGDHTWAHTDLTTLAFPDGVIASISQNKKYLEGLTGKTVKSLGVPFGKTNPNINNLLRSFYDGVRVSTTNDNNYGDVMNCYNISTHWIDYPQYTVAYTKGIIDKAINEDTAKWTVLSLHRLATDPAATDWTLAELEELADYLLAYQMQGKLEVVTLSEGARRMKSHAPTFRN